MFTNKLIYFCRKKDLIIVEGYPNRNTGYLFAYPLPLRVPMTMSVLAAGSRPPMVTAGSFGGRSFMPPRGGPLPPSLKEEAAPGGAEGKKEEERKEKTISVRTAVSYGTHWHNQMTRPTYKKFVRDALLKNVTRAYPRDGTTPSIGSGCSSCLILVFCGPNLLGCRPIAFGDGHNLFDLNLFF